MSLNLTAQSCSSPSYENVQLNCDISAAIFFPRCVAAGSILQFNAGDLATWTGHILSNRHMEFLFTESSKSLYWCERAVMSWYIPLSVNQFFCMSICQILLTLALLRTHYTNVLIQCFAGNTIFLCCHIILLSPFSRMLRLRSRPKRERLGGQPSASKGG